jgi:molybdate transport system substrate-binding protein
MRKIALLFVLLALVAGACSAQELKVAAAADLQFALQEVASGFQNQSGIAVKVTYGASGNLTTQIENGAPFDLFFSADSDFPRRLLQAGLADPASFYEYATGGLVLWVRNGSRLDLSRGMQVLTDPSIKKISIANPVTAPYGRAAVAALKSANLYDAVSSRLVMGENISQAAQYVQTGAADIGLLAISLAMSPTMSKEGHFAVVPAGSYPTMRQAVVIVAKSPHKTEAARFLEYVKQPQSIAILERYGFKLLATPHRPGK